MAIGGGRRAVLAALIGNAAIAVIKFLAWSVTGSSAVLAQAVHSTADAGNQALLLIGARRARRRAMDEEQAGFGRAQYFWSFAVGLVLFVLGSAFAVYLGVEQILRPTPTDNFVVALLGIGVGIVVEGFNFRTALVETLPRKGDRSWWNYLRRAGEPELPVVLLEGFGSQVGLMVAFVSIAIAAVTDNPVWDGIGSLAIGILLGVTALVLMVEMRSLVINDTVRPQDAADVKAAILSRPEVMELMHLRTQLLGPGELLVAARIEFDSSLTMDELAQAVDSVERTIRRDVAHVGPVYIEPDLRRLTDSESNGDTDSELNSEPNGASAEESDGASGEKSIILGADVDPNHP